MNNIQIGDYVRTPDSLNNITIGTVGYITHAKYVYVYFLDGGYVAREIRDIEKLSDGEAMLIKLENA